jgi:hypothetical protein
MQHGDIDAAHTAPGLFMSPRCDNAADLSRPRQKTPRARRIAALHSIKADAFDTILDMMPIPQCTPGAGHE